MKTKSATVFDSSQKPPGPHRGEVLIGYIQGVNDQKKPEVAFSADGKLYSSPALTTLPISMEHLGRNVVLSFIEGDLTQPIIMGLLWQPAETPVEAKQMQTPSDFPQLEMIRAKDQIQLKCGAASITLTKAGKILVRGKYISSRSSGVQRIRGGSVQIN